MKTSLRQEKGMVLLMVLVVVALLTSLLTEFAFTTMVDLRLTETFRDSTRAYYVAKGGVRVGQMLLQDDTNDYDARSEMWGQGIANYPVDEESTVTITIEDLGGRLNLNSLVTSQGNINAIAKDRFLRLFDILGTPDPNELTDSLIDWIDSNEDEEPRGGENNYYLSLDSPYPCKNGALNTVEELSLVKGFDAEIIKLVRPHVTIHGATKINVNTATAEVLYSLSADMDKSAAEDVLDRRNNSPFKKVSDVKEIWSESEPYYWAISNHITVKSETYRIHSWGTVNDGTSRVEAIVEKTGNKLLYLKVN